MAKDKTTFTCTECGGTSPRWLGKCPSCGAWNTLIEQVAEGRAGQEPPERAARLRRPGPCASR